MLRKYTGACLHDGKTAVMIEASSHGIAQTRLAKRRWLVWGAINYHGDLRAYWNAKKKLFAMPGLHGLRT